MLGLRRVGDGALMPLGQVEDGAQVALAVGQGADHCRVQRHLIEQRLLVLVEQHVHQREQAGGEGVFGIDVAKGRCQVAAHEGARQGHAHHQPGRRNVIGQRQREYQTPKLVQPDELDRLA